MAQEQKTITRRYAKRKFNTVGLALILYCLCVLVMPIFIKQLLTIKLAQISQNENLYIGIYYMIILIGTVLPFSLISKSFDVSFKDYFKKTSISTKEIIIEFIVFFTIASISIFAMYGIANYFSIQMNLIFNIGTVTSETHFDNPIYAVLFILACPFVEEIAYRGCLVKSFSRFGKKFAIVTSAVIYALAHGSFVEMIPALVIGYLLGKIEVKYHSIQPCVVIHIFFNLFIYLFYIISDTTVIYATAALAVIYLITLIMCLSKKYRFASIKTSQSPWPITEVLITTPTVVISLILFVLYSVFIEIIGL